MNELKKRPKIGQEIRWLTPKESSMYKPFLESQKRQFPGTLRVAEVVELQGTKEDEYGYRLHVSHDGTVMVSGITPNDPIGFSPFWFRLV